MASKTDLIEAQNFSRRRLLTAFVSGAPGGKELEPAKPLRAVVIAIVLTAAVLLAGAFYGLIQPGLPQGWQNGRMLIAKDTGARYVSVKGVLHPVINTASARLLIPSSSFAVITTDSHALSGIAVGSPVGIVGAPDALPSADALVNTGWTACVTDDGGVATSIRTRPSATATDRAVVVENGGERWVVAGGLRYGVDGQNADAVLRAAGIDALAPVRVSSDWLNLFSPGAALEPLVITDAGSPVPGGALSDGPLLVGEVIHTSGSAAEQRFVVQGDGSLATLSPLAWQLYQLGSGRTMSTVREVSAASVAGLRTAKAPAGGADWPAEGFTSLTASDRACALLSASGTTVLATAPASAKATSGVTVQAGHGALIDAAGRGAGSAGMLTLVDATGTAFALPGADDETVKRLGYTPDEVGTVEQTWIALLHSGPELSTSAAGATSSASAG
ncbi:type VII secretion protein EccB [Leifsonia sp. ZF2019]|uniref:type VII secretion protein EccB n=1 Tax=Leifsonia sp. ZF2019 TaxID=2781978 RepID=UPI001CBFCF5C|nr:type VII secretion protein EccB [Leifsonia sp. ZF2019]UAJ80487.1 type VII secretion protein EccB [Leifsonia sp. ZF2019]